MGSTYFEVWKPGQPHSPLIGEEAQYQTSRDSRLHKQGPVLLEVRKYTIFYCKIYRKLDPVGSTVRYEVMMTQLGSDGVAEPV